MENLQSSIGPTWPPMESSNERLRAFYTVDVITSQAEADDLNTNLYDAIRAMNDSDRLTRVSFRVVAELGSLARLQTENATIEAVLPITDTDLGVVYIGANSIDRVMDVHNISLHKDLLHTAVNHIRKTSPHDVITHVANHNQAAELAPSFAPLYAMLNYNLAETEGLLRNQANTIVYVMADDKIVATAMAEHATVNIAGYGDLSLVEITEGCTLPEYRQRGLYTAVSNCLVQQLIDTRQYDSSRIDVLYGESNLAMPGVIYAAHSNGRRFSYFDRSQLGVHNETFGILPQNFTVNDGTETRPYNDFAVSYIPL
jgi:hypothetical protein